MMARIYAHHFPCWFLIRLRFLLHHFHYKVTASHQKPERIASWTRREPRARRHLSRVSLVCSINFASEVVSVCVPKESCVHCIRPNPWLTVGVAKIIENTVRLVKVQLQERTFFLFLLNQQKLFRFKDKFPENLFDVLKLLLFKQMIRLFYVFKMITWEIYFELC